MMNKRYSTARSMYPSIWAGSSLTLSGATGVERPLTGSRYFLVSAMSVKRQNIILFDHGRKFYEREKKNYSTVYFFRIFLKLFVWIKKHFFFFGQ